MRVYVVYVKYKQRIRPLWRRSMPEQPNKIELRMTIEGKLAERLKRVKEHLGYESYTETIRALINKADEDLKRYRED